MYENFYNKQNNSNAGLREIIIFLLNIYLFIKFVVNTSEIYTL